jgi:2-amino-4-hydroxy-6-hydroxymethyldihydropteridine diphosphokinase
MTVAYIGIGSNVDRNANIRSGLKALAQLGSPMVVSTVYESKAFGFDGDNFYNLAVAIDTAIDAPTLNTILHGIEQQHGRARDVPRFSSRTLDLDLLLYGDLVRHDAVLDVPRSDIVSCAFVLRPLADIAGPLQHPESGIRIDALWAAFDRTDQQTWPVELETGL